LIKQTGHENKENDHQVSNVLIFNQILPTSNIRNIRRMVGLKGLSFPDSQNCHDPSSGFRKELKVTSSFKQGGGRKITHLKGKSSLY